MSSHRLRPRQQMVICGTPNNQNVNYNLSLHVGGLFIIFTVSFVACALPLFLVKIPWLRISPTFLFIVRHFGTGVLLATAFVHLLPTAFISLTDPCLPPLWNEDYPAMAGAIALGAVFVISIIEMMLNPGRKCCSMPGGTTRGTLLDMPRAYRDNGAERERQAASDGDQDQDAETPDNESTTGPLPTSGQHQPNQSYGYTSNRSGRTFSVGAHLDRISRPLNPASQATEPPLPQKAAHEKQHEKLEDIEAASSETGGLTRDQQRRKLLVQCLLLELGILFHSIFIGLALAVALGRDFVILLIAIAFHQLFEGLALGSRIVAIEWRDNRGDRIRPWLMAAAYGCTTPLGMVIGISTHTLYSPTSLSGLLMIGIMNAVSGGLLTFTGLIDLLSEDLLSDHSWKTLRGVKRLNACGLVFLGAVGMSIIGAWA